MITCLRQCANAQATQHVQKLQGQHVRNECNGVMCNRISINVKVHFFEKLVYCANFKFIADMIPINIQVHFVFSRTQAYHYFCNVQKHGAT